MAKASNFPFHAYVGSHCSYLFKHLPSTWHIDSIVLKEVTFYHTNGLKLRLFLNDTGHIMDYFLD